MNTATITASDQVDPNSANNTASVSYTTANTPPVAVNDSYSTAEDVALNVAAPGVKVNDSDVDGDPLTAILVTAPLHGTLTFNSNGSFVYTPNANYNGPDSFTYKVNDGIADSNVATVNITVTPVNDPPVAVNDAYSTAEDTPITIAAPGVLSNDTDIDGGPYSPPSSSDRLRTALSRCTRTARSPTRRTRTSTAPTRSPTRRTTER